MNYQSILYIVGRISAFLGVSMLLPAFIDWSSGDNTWFYFLESCGVTMITGVLIAIAAQPKTPPNFTLRDVFLMTVSCWLFLIFFASWPFWLSGVTHNFTDAFFEAASGLTTTGATVLSQLHHVDKGILLWRAMLQWMGGIGIIVMAISVMPLLKIGGMQLFRSEFSDKSEKILPRVSQISTVISSTYILITILGMLALLLTGISPFDSLCHCFTAVATGGMANYDSSIRHFDRLSVEIILSTLMIIGSLPLLLVGKCFKGEPAKLFSDSQVRCFLIFVFFWPLVTLTWLFFNTNLPLETLVREGIFNTVSAITATGLVTADFSVWGSFPVLLLVMLYTIGGCTGSTSGGIKIFRMQIIAVLSRIQILKLRRPHGVFIPHYNKKKIDETFFASVLTFIALYILFICFLSLALALSGLDITTAVTSTMAMLSNFGPSMGDLTGPTGNYAQSPPL